ncbi:MAG TPA: hypothetical protein VEH84_11095 [Alphaproteobacteria bacterium]|nr:hypothetical protein [Alphaproteobacteria bacterium]
MGRSVGIGPPGLSVNSPAAVRSRTVPSSLTPATVPVSTTARPVATKRSGRAAMVAVPSEVSGACAFGPEAAGPAGVGAVSIAA